MSTKSNTVFLNQIFDEAVNFLSDVLDSPSYQAQIPLSKGVESNYCSSIGSNESTKSVTTSSATNCVITTTGGGTFDYLYPGYQELKYQPFYQPPVIYGPIIWVDVLRDFTPSCSKKDIPSYPVSNFFVTNDGTSVIEIAVTSFFKEEVTVERKDLTLLVKGVKEKPADEKKEEPSKYFYRNLACRDFELEFKGHETWDFDKLEVYMDRGVLTIKVPLKEEFQPVRQKYEIK